MTIREKYKEQRELNKDKTVVLLGTAISCFEVDWDAENTEYWACGSAFGGAHDDIKKITRGFEIHDMDLILQISVERKVDYNKHNCPIMVQDENNPISKQLMNDPVTFPLDDLLQYITEMNSSKYFTSSFCYMIVYAGLMGFKNVRLNKILLTSGAEYFLERPGVEYWIDVMINKEGMRFSVPEDVDLFCNEVLYGYEERPNIWKIRSKNLMLWDRLVKHESAIETLTNIVGRANGMLYMNELMRSKQPIETINKVIAECKGALNTESKKLSDNIDSYNQVLGGLMISSNQELRGY
jgi:hypothetical protein